MILRSKTLNEEVSSLKIFACKPMYLWGIYLEKLQLFILLLLLQLILLLWPPLLHIACLQSILPNIFFF